MNHSRSRAQNHQTQIVREIRDEHGGKSMRDIRVEQRRLHPYYYPNPFEDSPRATGWPKRYDADKVVISQSELNDLCRTLKRSMTGRAKQKMLCQLKEMTTEVVR